MSVVRPSASDWSTELAVNEKTIARAFIAGTGIPFRQWRVQARMHAAAGLLAAGDSVQEVAAQVGYRSVSSFIAAFKERYDVTPARYAAHEVAARGLRSSDPSAIGAH